MTLELYGAEQRALGKYLANIEQIRHWMSAGKSDKNTAIEIIDVTPAQFDSVVNAISEHPEWDDERVYEEVDWHISSR